MKQETGYLPLVLGARLYRAIKGILKFLSLIPSTTHLGKKERSAQEEIICICFRQSHLIISGETPSNDGWMKGVHQNLKKENDISLLNFIIAKVSYFILHTEL